MRKTHSLCCIGCVPVLRVVTRKVCSRYKWIHPRVKIKFETSHEILYKKIIRKELTHHYFFYIIYIYILLTNKTFILTLNLGKDDTTTNNNNFLYCFSNKFHIISSFLIIILKITRCTPWNV